MSLSFYSSFTKNISRKKQRIKPALKLFYKTDLANLSEKQFKQSVKLYQQISSSRHIFIFAFGGIGSAFKTAQSFFSVRNKKARLIDSFNPVFKQQISKLSQKELKSSHFVFISKSGRTSEILFYQQFIQQIYFKNKLSLKNRLTIFTQNKSSPLLAWGKKEQTSIVYLEDSLTGRFSFFSCSGWLQFLACGLRISCEDLNSAGFFKENPSAVGSRGLAGALVKGRKARGQPIEYKNENKLGSLIQAEELSDSYLSVFDFFSSTFDTKEIYFCFFQQELKEISRWLEMSWSESLFKEGMKKQPPSLRAVSWTDLRHGFVEELIAKKKQVCFFGLDIKTNQKDPSKNKLKSLLESKKIDYLFVSMEKNMPSFLELIRLFYQVLFLAGEFSAVDFRTQPWVDYFKK